MDLTPCPLEARRQELYNKFPVPADWHQKYESGLVDTADYLLKARENLSNFEGLYQYCRAKES